jgi:predicted amidohydrolase YtcJ
MLVEDAKVVWRGSTSETPQSQFRDPNPIDHGERVLFPAFIDSHCHILPTGLDLQKLHLGPCQTHADVLDSVRSRLPQIEAGKWLLGVHYDQTKYDGVHLTRNDLDAISATVPILLRHVSGHASVANSAALKEAGVTDSAPDPVGGSFGRFEDGRINGVLFESAHETVSLRSPKPSLDEMVDAVLLAGEKMADLGIGCASDMMMGRFDLLQELNAYRIAAERGCRIHTRLYLQWGEVFRKDGGLRTEEIAMAINHYGSEKSRIGGVKIFADGAIGSATAAIYGAYSGESAAGHSISRHARDASDHSEQQVSGQLIYAPERLSTMVRIGHEAGFQVAIHSIGDYSTDLVMDAFEALDDARLHRIEHAMLLSDEQIERMAKIGCFCTMQPEFLMRFGHSYRRQLGPERTSKLKRFRSVKDAGIPLSFSSDRPIVGGDPKDGVMVGSNRPDGFDPSENLSHAEAIDCYTVEGARVNGDVDSMSSLEPGQWAHWQEG